MGVATDLLLRCDRVTIKINFRSANFEKTGPGVGYARGRVSTLVTPKIGTELIV